MPKKPGTACLKCGKGIVSNGVCSKCGPREKQQRPKACLKCGTGIIRNGVCSVCGPVNVPHKGSSGTTKYSRLYGRKWKEAKARFLANHPLCAQCRMDGLVRGADTVDHVTPHKGDESLFWDEANWQALCKRCHDRKTGRESSEIRWHGDQDGVGG